jgi:hypothetical protein
MRTIRRALLVALLVVLGATSAGLCTAQALQEDGLVLYAPMEEDAGNLVLDISSTGAEGQLSGDAAWTAEGKIGGAVRFGSDGYVEFAENPALNLTDELTMMAWILPTAAPGDTNLFGRRIAANVGGYTMQWTNNRVETHVYFGTWIGTRGLQALTPDIDSWHFVAGVYDGSNILQYVDGQRDAGVAASGAIGEIPGVFRIGQAQTNLPSMPGIIDEVAVYNRAMTFEEVEYIRANGMFGIGVDVRGKTTTTWAALKR